MSRQATHRTVLRFGDEMIVDEITVTPHLNGPRGAPP
jgi:hypothetical protein